MNTFFKMQTGQEYANRVTGKVGTIQMFPGYNTVTIHFPRTTKQMFNKRNFKSIEEFLEQYEIHIDPKGWEPK